MYKKGEYFGFSAAFVEVVILNYLENCTHFKWIARDQDGCLCIYEDKPHKEKTDDNIGYVYWNRSDIKPGDIEFLGPFENLFKFIKWEDSEPTSIEDILSNCEVIEVENATKIYIEQMRLEKEKLQQEYDDLCEGHDKLSYEWAKLKKENKELHDYYDDMRKNYNELVIKSNNLYSELYEEGYIEDD